MPLKIEFGDHHKRGVPPRNDGSAEASVEETSAKVSRLATAASISAFVATGCLIFAAVTHTQAASAVAAVEADMTTVVVAARDIPSGSTIREGMLTTAEIPSQYISDGTVSDIEDAMGKQTVVRIDANSQVREGELNGEKNNSSLADKLAKGKKAVSIDVSTESDFAQSLLHQGDLVTLYCFEGNSSGSKTKVRIVKNAPVLALDGYTSYDDMSPDGITASYSNVTVEVNAKTAEKIRQIQDDGTVIWMVLTAASDVKK